MVNTVLIGSLDESKITFAELKVGQLFKWRDSSISKATGALMRIGSPIYSYYINLSDGEMHTGSNSSPVEVLPPGTRVTIVVGKGG